MKLETRGEPVHRPMADSCLWNGLHDTLSLLGTEKGLRRLNDLASARGLINANGHALRFITQSHALGQVAYERQIYEAGEIPTRVDSWHDFYNACIWLTYPKLKAALNAVHIRWHNPQRRSRASDAATLFDESGAIFMGPELTLAQDLQQHRWTEAFVTKRPKWQTHQLLITGHAALEKLHAPYAGMIVKALYVQCSDAMANPTPCQLSQIDAVLADYWNLDFIESPAQLFPLPILGVPGATPKNKDSAYYNNLAVFRPLKTSEPPAYPTIHLQAALI
jgi:hypothetical protein